MSMTPVDLAGTALASGLGASLFLFLTQKLFDRRLEHYFNARLEELKASLQVQAEVKNQIATQRLEIYPAIAESVYRLRNSLLDMNTSTPVTLDTALGFLRLAEQYTEQIYAARFYLELDQVFEGLHDYKDHVLAAKNLLLDWIHLVQNQPLGWEAEIARVLRQLKDVGLQLENEHRQLIRSFTRLTGS